MKSRGNTTSAFGAKRVFSLTLILARISFSIRSLLLLGAIAFTAAVSTGLFVPNWNWSALEAIGTTAAVITALWASGSSRRAEAVRVRSSREIAIIIHEPLIAELGRLETALDPSNSIPGISSALASCRDTLVVIDDVSMQLSWVQDDLKHMDKLTIHNLIMLRSIVGRIRMYVANLEDLLHKKAELLTYQEIKIEHVSIGQLRRLAESKLHHLRADIYSRSA